MVEIKVQLMANEELMNTIIALTDSLQERMHIITVDHINAT